MPNGAPAYQSDLLSAPANRLTRVDADSLFLLREMNHRLANSLAILNGILRRELGPSAPPRLLASLDRCEARILALSDLHRYLTVGAQSGWISVQLYLEQLCEVLTEAVLQPLRMRCEVSADAAFMPGEYCELFGLVITELVPNAAKHAFCGRDDGLVRVEFISTTDTWTCIVSDNGLGASATRTGVGSKVLGALLHALGAELVRKSGRTGTASVVTCKFQPEFGV
jgi:two-component sensor histidine kinase